MDFIIGILVVVVIGFAVYGIYKFYLTKQEEQRKLFEQKKESMIKNVIREILTNSESNNSEEMVNRCYLDYIDFFNSIIGKFAVAPDYEETLLETYLFAVIAYNNTFMEESAKNEFLEEFSEIIGDRQIDWKKLKPKLIDIFQKSLINPMMDANKAFEKMLSDPNIYTNSTENFRYSLSSEQNNDIDEVPSKNEQVQIDEKNIKKVMSALDKINTSKKIDFNL